VAVTILVVPALACGDAAEPRTAGSWVRSTTCAGDDRVGLASRNVGDVDGDSAVHARNGIA